MEHPSEDLKGLSTLLDINAKYFGTTEMEKNLSNKMDSPLKRLTGFAVACDKKFLVVNDEIPRCRSISVEKTNL